MTFARYTAIQFLAYMLDMAAFLAALTMEAIGPVSANVMAKFIAGFFAFVAHRNFTFINANKVSAKEQALKYFVFLALNIPLASVMLILFMMLLSDPVVAKFIADIVCVGLTYFLSKCFIFKSQSKPEKFDTTGIVK